MRLLILDGIMGFEPTSSGWQPEILTKLNYIPMEARPRVELESRDYKSLILATKLAGHLDQYKGFEPSPTEWKSVMLPLHQYWIYKEKRSGSYDRVSR